MVTLWLGDEEKEIFLTHTENVSIAGICLILNQRLERMAEVCLELDLLDLKDHVKCRGKVMWVVECKGKGAGGPFSYDTGIEFLDIGETDRNRIHAIIKQLAKYPQNRA